MRTSRNINFQIENLVFLIGYGYNFNSYFILIVNSTRIYGISDTQVSFTKMTYFPTEKNEGYDFNNV